MGTEGLRRRPGSNGTRTQYGNSGPQTPAGLKHELQGRDMRWKDGDIIDMCIPKETECSRDGVYNSFR